MPTSAEGFGLPVLEALALGTPVVANDILAIRSWAKRSVTYSCVDAPNEWATALDAALALDDGHRRRGQIVAQAFRWRECAAKLIVF
jgi:glycosyltransferase involved in cell wall biosynthesis